jgi:hypothetical protein
MIELFDARKRPLLRARLSGDERIELSAAGGERPWIPARVEIESLTDGSTVRVTLSGATDRRISDQAFDFEAIARTYGVARIERLEVRPIPAQPGR